MIFCSSDRIKKLSTETDLLFDISMRNTRFISAELDPDTKRGRCYAINYDVANIQGSAMAFTTLSDFIDKGAYIDAPRPKRMQDFLVPRPNIAYSIDFCTWFLHKSLQQGWPRISKERIIQTQQPGFVGGVKWYATPVDGLRNKGLSMLHEVTSLVRFHREV
jgi:hypothetical protein